MLAKDKDKEPLAGWIVVERFLHTVSMKTNRRVSIRFLPLVFCRGEEKTRDKKIRWVVGALPNSRDDVLCLTGCFIFRWQVAIEKFTAMGRDTETTKKKITIRRIVLCLQLIEIHKRAILIETKSLRIFIQKEG